MSLRSHITDSSTKKTAEVDAADGEIRGLVTAVRPLKTFENTIQFFTDNNGSVDLNVDAATTGTPDVIYAENSGTPTEWDWTIEAGAANRFDFAHSVTVHAGSTSIDGTNSRANNVAQGDNGSNISLSVYTSLSGFIYLTSWAITAELLIYGWDTNLASMIGTSVDIGDYINVGTLNTWQKFTIPLSDLTLVGASIDAIRVQLGPTNPPPNYYLDDIQLDTGGGVMIFTVQPDNQTWLHIKDINLVIADGYTGILSDGTMPNLSYNKILGLSKLTNGIVYQRIINGEIVNVNVVRQLSDVLQLPGSSIKSLGSDGTNTFMNLNITPTEPLVLKSETNDELRIILSDNLSELLLFRSSVGAGEEQRSIL